jgi:hypothetical protein
MQEFDLNDRSSGEYTDIVRLVFVKRNKDMEMAENEKIIKITEFKLYEGVEGFDGVGCWVVLHVRKYINYKKRE